MYELFLVLQIFPGRKPKTAKESSTICKLFCMYSRWQSFYCRRRDGEKTINRLKRLTMTNHARFSSRERNSRVLKTMITQKINHNTVNRLIGNQLSRGRTTTMLSADMIYFIFFSRPISGDRCHERARRFEEDFCRRRRLPHTIYDLLKRRF